MVYQHIVQWFGGFALLSFYRSQISIQFQLNFQLKLAKFRCFILWVAFRRETSFLHSFLLWFISVLLSALLLAFLPPFLFLVVCLYIAYYIVPQPVFPSLLDFYELEHFHIIRMQPYIWSKSTIITGGV